MKPVIRIITALLAAATLSNSQEEVNSVSRDSSMTTATLSTARILGATVFRSKDSAPCTLVRYWPAGKGRDITFWSSADFALIAGGINSFLDLAGKTHHVLMESGIVEIDRMADLRTSQGLEYDAPPRPDFPEGKGSFQVIGEQPAADELVAIQALHDIYTAKKQFSKMLLQCIMLLPWKHPSTIGGPG